MRNFFIEIPRHHKYLFYFISGIGVLIFLCSAVFPPRSINTFIFFYGFGVPMLFLVFLLLSLNDNKIFIFWFIFSVILLVFSLLTSHSNQFLILRSSTFNGSSGVNSALVGHSTSTLKAFFFFLIVYWPLNQVSKKLQGNCIANTFMQTTMTNAIAQRKMTGVDVLCNLALFITIFIATLF